MLPRLLTLHPSLLLVPVNPCNWLQLSRATLLPVLQHQVKCIYAASYMLSFELFQFFCMLSIWLYVCPCWMDQFAFEIQDHQPISTTKKKTFALESRRNSISICRGSGSWTFTNSPFKKNWRGSWKGRDFRWKFIGNMAKMDWNWIGFASKIRVSQFL